MASYMITDEQISLIKALLERLPETKDAKAAQVGDAGDVPAAPAIKKLPDEVILEKGQSLQDACDKAKNGGRVVTVPAGMKLGPQKVMGLGDKPFWLRAERPGEAEISTLVPKAEWREEKDGIWSCAHGKQPWAGSCVEEGLYLANYKSLGVLGGETFSGVHKNTGKTETHKKTEYGFAHQRGKLFVRLPKGMDPNKLTMEFDDGTNRKLLRIEDSAGIIADGFRFAGSGLKEAICISGRSQGATLRNNVMEICRFGARLVDDCTMSWNQYTFPGFRRWLKDMRALNGSGHAGFAYIKYVYTAPGNKNNPLIGGRIAQGSKEETKGCRFEYNLCKDVWDAHRYGQFSESEIYRDIGYCVGDDFVEFEGINSKHLSRNNKVTECWALDCMGSYFSAQDKSTLRGPGHVKDCVMGSTDPDLHVIYAVKDMWLDKSKEFTFENCLIQVPHTGRHSSWGDSRWVILPIKKSNPEKIRLINSVIVAKRVSGWNNPDKPNVAGNLMIGENAKEYTGNGGNYGGGNPSKFFEGWDDINTLPDRLVPIRDLGVGPKSYEPPRPLTRAFDHESPKGW